MRTFTRRRALGLGLVLAMLTTVGWWSARRRRAHRRRAPPRRSARCRRPAARGMPPAPPTRGSPTAPSTSPTATTAGFSGSPGLDQEMGDAVKAMVAWCNAQGGINGRQIVGDYYDSAVTNVGSVMTQACKTDFMLVGEGFALDGLAEQTRLGCNLAAVPGFTVSPVVANAYEMYQAVAEPGERQPGGDRLPGREALRLQDAARRPVQLHPLHPASVDGQGRAGATRRPAGSSSIARSWSTTTARPTTRRSCRSSRAAGPRSSSTTPPRGQPSTAPSRRRTRSATTRSG